MLRRLIVSASFEIRSITLLLPYPGHYFDKVVTRGYTTRGREICHFSIGKSKVNIARVVTLVIVSTIFAIAAQLRHVKWFSRALVYVVFALRVSVIFEFYSELTPRPVFPLNRTPARYVCTANEIAYKLSSWSEFFSPLPRCHLPLCGG